MSVDTDILSINNLTMGYGGAPVIRDINLNVKSGEFFGLIGVNGAGKTTMMKSILGLRKQERGEITLFGHEITNKKSKSQLAYLPERFEPAWFLTGMEFLKFSLKIYKQPFDEALVLKSAEMLALDPKALRRLVQTYSKGMRQKLGILGTILTNCQFLMLDEPMSGLDPLARTLVKDMLAGCKAQKQTVFFSSHILADMDELCDRVAVLHNGIIQFVGTPADLKTHAGAPSLERAFLHFIEKDKAA